MKPASPTTRLPAHLKALFWEYDFGQLGWETDRDLIIGRILTDGGWESVQWLVGHLGRTELRRWIEQREGRGLDARRLRFWELILGLPRRRVTHWIQAADGVWARRMVG